MTTREIISLDTTVPQLRAPTTGDTYRAPRTIEIQPETGTSHLDLMGSSSGRISIKSQSASGTYSLTLPTALPGSTGFVKSDVSGNVSFDTNTYLTGNQTVSLTGDVTGSGATSIGTTLATVNSNVGSFALSTVTVNAKGLVTGASAASTTGSGNVVLATSPTLVTPALGTPASGTLTNCTGYPSQVAGTTLSVQYNNAGAFAGANLWITSTNAVEQYNGVTAQAHEVYNTRTDASNYERGAFDFTTTANTLTIGTQKAGTGSTRGINMVVGGSTALAIGTGQGVTLTPAAGNSALTITGATETTSQPLISGTQTWNAGAVTFTGIKLNVTNTASAASSKLLDLQVGGTSKVFADTNGNLIATGGGSNVIGVIGSALNFGVSYSGGSATIPAYVATTGLFFIGSGGGIGYGTGAGGAQTQTTSRTTGVTLNKPCGAITLVSAAGSTSWQSFTLTNSVIAATDVVRVCQKSGTDLYQIHVTNVATGSCQITFATTGGTTTEQPVFNFAVIKAVTA